MQTLPAATYVVMASWAVFLVVWLASSLGAKRTLRRRYGGAWLRLALGAAVVLIVQVPAVSALAARYDAYLRSSALSWVGAAACAAGIALAVWARVNLGRNWGMPMSVKESPELVTSGPYAYVRHPIYAGVILALLGSGLATSVLWLAISLAMAGYFVYAAYREEALLAREFPDAYPAYRARTRMLVPFLL